VAELCTLLLDQDSLTNVIGSIMSERIDFLRDTFKSLFGSLEDLAFSRAPGRINLIGEHTDYNDGFVLPIAVPRDISIVFRRINEPRVELWAANFEEKGSLDLDDLKLNNQSDWMKYPLGVATLLAEKGCKLRGIQGVIHGTIPVGGGMSSSAALCVSVALALCHAAAFKMDKLDVARMCQEAERRFAGVSCGIMDQYVSLFAKRSRALLLDCRELAGRPVPFESLDADLLVFDTGVKHTLANSAYNERRSECEAAVRILKQFYPEITALRDVSVDEFLAVQDKLPQPARKRAHHVITENARTESAAAALVSRNPLQLGVYMAASHDSLRDDYEVSCMELDTLVEITSSMQGEIGSRMTGAGFGGCMITLVDPGKSDLFRKEVPRLYKERTGFETEAFLATAEEGAYVRKL